MIYDTVAVREWADMPVPEDPEEARKLWAQLRDDVVEACDVIDALTAALAAKAS